MSAQNRNIQRISDFLNIDTKELEKKGIFNSFIGVDSRFFIDPFLTETIDIPEFQNAREKIKKYYHEIITLLKVSKAKGDLAWNEAAKRLIFKEFASACIGYGGHGNTGSGIGPVLGRKLLNTADEIVGLGIEDPLIFELIGLFEKNYGPDRLSDMTIAILRENFLEFTQRITQELGIQDVTTLNFSGKDFILPRHGKKFILFLPENLLRDLPVAQSWEEIGNVAEFNKELRNRYNKLVASVWKDHANGKPPTKEIIKALLLKNKDNLSTLLDSYKVGNPKPYDFKSDPNGEIEWYDIAKSFVHEFPFLGTNKPQNENELYSFVTKIIQQFKRGIELNGLNQFLYTEKGKKKHERFSQILFYSVCDIYASIFDFVVSREPNAGSGAVDFSLATGYKNKVVVEIKLSTGKVVSGYEKQLPIYQSSENASKAIYIVIRVSDGDGQIKKIQSEYAESIKKGLYAPEIFVVDGRKYPSASNR